RPTEIASGAPARRVVGLVLDQPAYRLLVVEDQPENRQLLESLLVAAGFEKSNGAARRLLQAGGCYVNDERIEDLDRQITAADFTDGRMNLRAGKKNVRRIILRS
ncbi:MAG: hypothetical protein QF541_08555, partial [Lentisphaeria bacterium]|nr:hypothetical protein [Lentisphaeria bacterium]